MIPDVMGRLKNLSLVYWSFYLSDDPKKRKTIVLCKLPVQGKDGIVSGPLSLVSCFQLRLKFLDQPILFLE